MRHLCLALLVTVTLAGCPKGGDEQVRDVADLGPDMVDTQETEIVFLTDTAETEAEVTADVPADEHPDGWTPGPLCKPGDGCFLDPCDENADCLSEWCVEHMGDAVCTILCETECPQGWHCQQVSATGPDAVFICVSDFTNLCKPCATNGDCLSAVGVQDACLSYGDEGSFCGGTCVAETDCPWGFSCKPATTVEGATLAQCVADAGICPCTQRSIDLGLATPCEATNALGTCAGKRVCTEAGLAPCNAATPAAEICNGLDDDCDGDVDEKYSQEDVAICDDGNLCTNDSCQGEEGCAHEPLTGTECIDGDPCTVVDHCDAGQCVGTPVLCDDDNPCTDDACDGAGGCLATANSLPCDDGDPCTVADQCADSTCQGFVIDCGCLDDLMCQPLEDGDLCNGMLYCDKGKLPYQCAVLPGSQVSCPDPEGDAAQCQQAACAPETGECSFVPAHDGFACNDGDACTMGETCSEGECTGGVPVNCNDGNPCTDDVCAAEAGCGQEPNSAPCFDGSVCTVGDTCADGTCVPGGAAACDDQNPCTDDGCDPTAGCTHTANAAACDDLSACTTGDHCADGQCVAAGQLSCDDGDPCTGDECDPGLGCVHTLAAAPCDDGDPCTVGDTCQVGLCLGVNVCQCQVDADCAAFDDADPCNGKPACRVDVLPHKCELDPATVVVCDPQGDTACRKSACDPATGGCNLEDLPDGTLCTDANPCTLDDACQAGVCAFAVNLCECEADADCVAKDDGDLCNGVFACDKSGFPYKCVFDPGTVVQCDKGGDTACLANTCAPAAGNCSMTPVNENGPCEDGNGCTLGDACAAGTCTSGKTCAQVNAVCLDNKCVGLVCNPGEKKCQGNQVATCNAFGTQWSLAPCAAKQFCDLGLCKDTPVVQSWEGVNPKPTPNDLMSIACIAADNCWAVGIKGTVLHTTNGGSTWPLLAGITQATISKVRFVEANHGFMLVGATLYRTSDAGAHWFAAPLPGSANDFSFVDAQTGWACGTGGKIWKTADNGGTWTEQSSGTLGDLYGIAMASSSVGWVVGINGIVRATADGGGKWTSQTSGTQSSLRAVHAFDAQSALAVGDGGTILLASIGGSTWTPVASGTGQHLQAVAFSGSAGWAVGNTGVVLRSTDLGHTFQPTPSGTQAGLFGVAAPDASTMYAVGAGGTIIKTVNGGTAFTNFSSSVTTSTLNDIAWATGTTGVVVGDGGLILLTQDGGTTWGKVTSGFAVAFKAVAFPTPTVGFIAGAGGRVLRSSDAGASWAPLTTGVTADLEELRFLSDTLGFASGANGTLIKTADGGTTWTKLVTGMGGTLLGLWFTDEDHGWIGTDWGGMGGDAIVKRTIDGGQFWAYTANAPNYQHSDWGNADIWFRDNDEGWSVGRHCCSSNGIIRHLLKSGDQWNVQTSVAGGLYAIAFFNQGLGLVVGKDGIVVQSTDAGSSWAQLPALTSATLYGVAFKPAGEAWIVGQNGVILKAIAKP